jgi:hypothetical protein
VDVKGPSELAVAPPRNERRELAREVPVERDGSPGVIVEIGRPSDLAGTYNARGVLEGSPAALKAPTNLPASGAPPESARPPLAAAAAIPTGAPEALRVPANAQVQILASASPQVAASLRPTVPMEAAHLHPPALAVTAGIQTLAASALKQAERGTAAAEHDEETDPLRKEKDQPMREAGKRRGR